MGTTYNNSYNTFYPGMFDYSQPPPGYPVYPNGYPASYPQGDGYSYGGRMEEDRWRADRRRPRSRSRDRGNYSNWERVHGDMRDGRGMRDRRRRGRSRSRERRK